MAKKVLLALLLSFVSASLTSYTKDIYFSPGIIFGILSLFVLSAGPWKQNIVGKVGYIILSGLAYLAAYNASFFGAIIFGSLSHCGFGTNCHDLVFYAAFCLLDGLIGASVLLLGAVWLLGISYTGKKVALIVGGAFLGSIFGLLLDYGTSASSSRTFLSLMPPYFIWQFGMLSMLVIFQKNKRLS